VGIDFTGKCDRAPNTLLAHAFLDHVLVAYGSAKQNEVQEALFKSYFTDGNFPDLANLTTIGESCGCDGDRVREALSDKDFLKKVQSEIRRNSRAMNSGVPMFIFNGQPTFSGARDVATFHRVFDSIL